MRCIPFSVLALLGLLVSACAATAPVPTTAPSSQGGEPSVPADGGSACDEAFAAAAGDDGTQDTLEHLYPTVRACESVVEWVGGVAANPGAIETNRGDVRVILGNVCGSRTAGSTALSCASRSSPRAERNPSGRRRSPASPSCRRDHGDGEVLRLA